MLVDPVPAVPVAAAVGLPPAGVEAPVVPVPPVEVVVVVPPAAGVETLAAGVEVPVPDPDVEPDEGVPPDDGEQAATIVTRAAVTASIASLRGGC